MNSPSVVSGYSEKEQCWPGKAVNDFLLAKNFEFINSWAKALPGMPDICRQNAQYIRKIPMLDGHSQRGGLRWEVWCPLDGQAGTSSAHSEAEPCWGGTSSPTLGGFLRGCPVIVCSSLDITEIWCCIPSMVLQVLYRTSFWHTCGIQVGIQH